MCDLRKLLLHFLVEDSKDGPAGTPAAKGPVVECPWCLHTFPPMVHKNINDLDALHAKAKGVTVSLIPRPTMSVTWENMLLVF